jgi:serine/threonine protein kinase
MQFALKRIEYAGRNDERGWEREFHAMRTLKHQHIIDSLGAFKDGQKAYLCMPWANGGSLRDFWAENTPDHEDSTTLPWLLKQLRGLTSALAAVHRPGTDQAPGRHGDVKPENILLFDCSVHPDDRGILQLADMGLANVSSSFRAPQPEWTCKLADFGSWQPTSPQATSPSRGVTLGYRAPEYDLHESTSQAYDVWSLGCVFLEFIVWWLYGFDDVAKFQAHRLTVKTTRAGKSVNDHAFFDITRDGKTQEPLAAILKSSVLWVGLTSHGQYQPPQSLT